MVQALNIPHRVADGLCPVNGIRDLVQWRTGRDWSNEFVWGLALGGGFAYLRVKVADPPRQVYWGNSSPRQHKYLAELFGAEFATQDNRSFKFAWKKAQAALDAGAPPILGPLDMYYLPFYPGLYHERHIPIHYVMLVGYDDTHAYVHDTGNEGVQTISLEELQLAWDVNVPGMGKRNGWASLDIPAEIPPTEALVRKSIADECQIMLNPPISMLGIPAMIKVAREIACWPVEFGDAVADKCLRQVREYLNSPPDIEGDNLTAGRHLYIAFLEEAQAATDLDLSTGIGLLRESMAVIPQIAKAIDDYKLGEAGQLFGRIVDIETRVFTDLGRVVVG